MYLKQFFRNHVTGAGGSDSFISTGIYLKGGLVTLSAFCRKNLFLLKIAIRTISRKIGPELELKIQKVFLIIGVPPKYLESKFFLFS